MHAEQQAVLDEHGSAEEAHRDDKRGCAINEETNCAGADEQRQVGMEKCEYAD
jgi:hypothetical protein